MVSKKSYDLLTAHMKHEDIKKIRAIFDKKNIYKKNERKK